MLKYLGLNELHLFILTNKCDTKALCSFWLENHPAQHPAGNKSNHDLTITYSFDVEAVMTNPPYLVLFLVVGGAVGFFNAFSTQVLLLGIIGFDSRFSFLNTLLVRLSTYFPPSWQR